MWKFGYKTSVLLKQQELAEKGKLMDKRGTVIMDRMNGYNLEQIEDIQHKRYNLEKKVIETLHEVGVPAHVKGYQYLIDAISLLVGDLEMTGVMYLIVAEHHQTTVDSVKAAIRYVVDMAWERGKRDTLDEIFGYTINTGKGKPTNFEFIALLADKIRIETKYYIV